MGRATLNGARAAAPGGQVLETGGPPAGADGLDELRRQPLRLHLARQGLVIVGHGAELDLEPAVELEQGVRHLGAPVVGRTPDGAHVHHVASARQRAVPGDPGMGAQDHVGLVAVA